MHHDDRMPMARAYQRATRGVTIATGMVVPGMLGYWADTRLGTRAVFTILGFGMGMGYGILELVRLGRPKNAPPQNDPSVPGSSENPVSLEKKGQQDSNHTNA